MTEISEAAKEKRNAYKREWYRKNKERAKLYNLKYWERKAAAEQADMKDQADNEQE